MLVPRADFVPEGPQQMEGIAFSTYKYCWTHIFNFSCVLGLVIFDLI